jgi:hypothetical protein
VLSLVAWWRDNQEGFSRPQGALYCALTSTRPQSDSGLIGSELGRHFPPLDPAYVQRVRDRERSQREALAERKRKKEEFDAEVLARANNQLELDFGSVLDAMEDDALLSLCPTPILRSQLKKHGKQSPLIRPLLLQLLADQAG